MTRRTTHELARLLVAGRFVLSETTSGSLEILLQADGDDEPRRQEIPPFVLAIPQVRRALRDLKAAV